MKGGLGKSERANERDTSRRRISRRVGLEGGRRGERGRAEIHPIGGLAPVGSPTVNEKMAAGLGGSVAIV